MCFNLQLGVKLYRLQGSNDEKLLKQVVQLWEFINTNHLINTTTYLIAGRANTTVPGKCSNNGDYKWVYVDGMAVGALVEMSRIFNNQSYVELAHRIANATIRANTIIGTFITACDLNSNITGCDDDSKVFKGLFVRNLRYLMDASNSTIRSKYALWLRQNMESVINYDICEIHSPISKCHVIYQDGPPSNPKTGPVFGQKWHGPFSYADPMQQASVLDLFVANILPGTLCKGLGCSYDPATPLPKHLTCLDDPCPPGKPCCNYHSSFTCCDRSQKCVKGVCT
jgi:mannan endo-1,6-alpha-mannosidase